MIPERLAPAKTKDRMELVEEGSIPQLVTHAANWGKRLVLVLLILAELQMLMMVHTPPKGFTIMTTSEPNYRSIYQLIN